LTILQLTHQGDGAGSTQSILDLSRALSSRGHRVVMGCRVESLLARTSAEAGLEVAPLDFRKPRPLRDAIEATIARLGVEVVNSHATRDRRALTRLRWSGRLPQAFVTTRRTMPLSAPIEVLGVGLTADRTIAVSEAVARALRARWQPGGRLAVVPNGIRLERLGGPLTAEERAQARAALGEPGERPVVAVLARKKDQAMLLRALPRMQHPIALALVGLTPDPELEALAAAARDRHAVAFVPFTPTPLRFYRIATLAALPSRIEGLSQSLLEAMAIGLPVVASDAGGNPDLVRHGETGLLVPPLDPGAWAAALDALLADPARMARMGASGRDLVAREYTIERTAERTEAVYRAALERRGAPALQASSHERN
jgi:glycosyltransferase involved in cell wall biosynthesis